MKKQCIECGSFNTEFTDSHWSYINPRERQVIKYFKCNNCGKEFSDKGFKGEY